MSEYTAIRVTEAAKADAQAAKREDETWDDYVRRCAANPPETVEVVESDSTGLDDFEAALHELEDRTGRLERLLEDMANR